MTKSFLVSTRPAHAAACLNLRNLPASVRFGRELLCGLAVAFAAFSGTASAATGAASVITPVTAPVTAPVTTAAAATSAANDANDVLARGKYLATAADCMACHTASKGQPFAGGYAIETPIGQIYSSNITPSRTAGIGNYTEAQFAAALKRGVRADGSNLYPAMPYTSYAKLTDADVAAMYAYFMQGVQPVDSAPAHQTALGFPFNIRASMMVWNLLFLDTRQFEPDPSKSAEWNRGMYLAEGLAHCATCHTPRNALMAEDRDLALSGSSLGSWYAPNITSDKVAGVGGWTHEELFNYLKTGVVAGKAQAAGPMAEAIENSLQHLSTPDLNAIVTYLTDVRPVAAASAASATTSTGDKPRYAYGKPSDSEAQLRGAAADNSDRGWQIFSGSCAACHQSKGSGLANGDYPSLYQNSATGAERPDNLVATILFGLHRTTGQTTRFMPGFGSQASFTERLSDEEIAQVSNYVLKQYGNPNVSVTKEFVATMRAGAPKPLIARLAPALAFVLILLVLLVLRRFIVRRGRKSTASTL